MRIVNWPEAPPKGDAADYPANDDELRELLDNAIPYEPTLNGASSSAEELHLTDLGNAKRLISLAGENLRHVTRWGRWLLWTGTHWAEDDTAEVYRLATNAVLSIYEEAARAGTESARRDTAEHAVRSESRGRIEAMVSLAESEAGVALRASDLDIDPWLFNCSNGTLDLRTGELRDHRRDDLITKVAPAKFDPDAEAPVFMAFLDRIMGSNMELIRYLKRTLGRSLSGDVSEHRLEVWHGPGANGKSTLNTAVQGVMGDYARMAAPGLLLSRASERHATEVADLLGARFVVSMEIGENRRLDEERVKQLTGGDRLKARRMREDYWEFDQTHKLFVCCNHKPTIRGSDHAIWRRVRLVPFTVVIPDAEQDKKLNEKLRRERSGILNWLLQGCLDWQADGIAEPEVVRVATDNYRAEQDVVAGFLAECCVTGENKKAAAGDLYDAYSKWCRDSREEQVSKRAFGLRLAERGFTQGRGSGGTRAWLGVGLTVQDSLDLGTE